MRKLPMGPKEVVINGTKILTMTLGQLARTVGRQGRTMRAWEHDGILPPPMYRSKSGYRMYTVEEVDAVVKSIEGEGVKNGLKMPESFKRRLHERFAAIRDAYRRSGLIQ